MAVAEAPLGTCYRATQKTIIIQRSTKYFPQKTACQSHPPSTKQTHYFWECERLGSFDHLKGKYGITFVQRAWLSKNPEINIPEDQNRARFVLHASFYSSLLDNDGGGVGGVSILSDCFWSINFWNFNILFCCKTCIRTHNLPKVDSLDRISPTDLKSELITMTSNEYQESDGGGYRITAFPATFIGGLSALLKDEDFSVLPTIGVEAVPCLIGLVFIDTITFVHISVIIVLSN